MNTFTLIFYAIILTLFDSAVDANRATMGVNNSINLDSVSAKDVNAGDVVTIFYDTTCDSFGAAVIHDTLMTLSGCDSIVILNISYLPIPESTVTPADITIQSDAMPFEITIPEVPNATSYTWELPAGVQLLSGANTTTVLLDWSQATTGGLVCVSASNFCGSGPSNCLEVFIDGTIAIEEVKLENYIVFPNPASTVITIVPPDEKPFTTTLFDASARVVFSDQTTRGQTQLQINDLIPGSYWMKIHRKDFVVWEQVTIVNK